MPGVRRFTEASQQIPATGRKDFPGSDGRRWTIARRDRMSIRFRRHTVYRLQAMRRGIAKYRDRCTWVGLQQIQYSNHCEGVKMSDELFGFTVIDRDGGEMFSSEPEYETGKEAQIAGEHSLCDMNGGSLEIWLWDDSLEDVKQTWEV